MTKTLTLTMTSKPSSEQSLKRPSTPTWNQSSTQSSEQTSTQTPIFLTTRLAKHSRSPSAPPEPLKLPQAPHPALATTPAPEQLLPETQKTQSSEKKEDLQPPAAWSLLPLAVSMPPALHGSSVSKLQLLELPTSRVCLKKIINLSFPKFQQN